MKFLLFTSYGTNNLPKALKKEMDKFPFPLCRAKVVDFIEKNARLINKQNGSSMYVFENTFLTVRNVDISRPWHIAEYDGGEYIQYLDYDIVDEDLNFCRLRV